MAPPKSVLIVEDEVDLAGLVRFNLEKEGYTCRCASDGRTALAEVRRHMPNLILLDRMLPGMSGDDVLAELRRTPRTAAIPVIMLTAKADEADELVGFALGADDYVTKPYSIKKLLARVVAVLRRAETTEVPATRVEQGPFILDPSRHELLVADEPVSLTATEFKLLHALMTANGRVLNRSQLIDATMGVEAAVTDRTIDVHVTSLRKKLADKRMAADASAWIQTVRGVGYAFRSPA